MIVEALKVAAEKADDLNAVIKLTPRGFEITMQRPGMQLRRVVAYEQFDEERINLLLHTLDFMAQEWEHR
jgi:hypothetical protein